MELLTHRYLPQSMFDFGSCWYDEPVHIMMPGSLFLDTRRFDREPRKHRVTVDVAGYNPESIKTEIKDGNKLIVYGKEEIKSENEDFSIKEFRKSFDLPENAETDKMNSFINKYGRLIVEVPLRHKEHVMNDEVPRVVENKETGSKSVSMRLSLPLNIDPSKITVTCKDSDLIVKAEDTRHFYYKRFSLPDNADLNGIKCSFENSKLLIEAPLKEQRTDEENCKQIPIDFKNN